VRHLRRFLLPLIVVFGVLSWGAAELLSRVSRNWYERDTSLRAALVMSGARVGLLRAWNEGDVEAVTRILQEITRDERLLAATACSPTLTVVAQTADFPEQFSCAETGPRIRGDAASPVEDWRTLSELRKAERGSLHVSAFPIVDEARVLGFVVLVHDMKYADRRGAHTLRLTLLSFAVLLIAACAFTILLLRASWRNWSEGIRALVRGEPERPEFLPLLKDVRELVASLAVDADAAADAVSPSNPWTPSRLKHVLKRHLQGEKVVIVANREPYIHQREPDGQLRVLHPASGLVTALEPVMRACSGVWVAHGSGSADRDTVDGHSRVWVPPDEKSYQIRRVWLSDAEERGYYYGLSNEGLWPLCHIAHTRPTFRTEDWEHYKRVNQRFADTACQEAEGDDPIILVQDYHFALAPRMIRARLPRATILTFWHIPWPNAERFGICPFRKEIVEGMLGSSIVGFHTQLHCNNFVDSVDRFLEARIDREQLAVVQQGRPTLVRPYPISIDWPNRWLQTLPSVGDCRASVISELGLRADALIGLGIDRLDYTKGVEERFLAVERLLERFAHLRGRFTFVQLAAPSRVAIATYNDFNERVEAVAARINARFGRDGYQPIVLRRTHHEPPTVFRYYRAADVCYVSSLHDGMNLVAKEFVAARDDEHGVLVLSHFTGAARELTEALIVNPYDIDQAASALATALAMSGDEQAERLRAMRSYLEHFNVYRWAGRMIVDAAQLRRQHRLTGKLGDAIGVFQGANG
jgi:trehalose 6-phosphate synthase